MITEAQRNFFYSSVRPKIICLCGSTRFKDEFVNANLEATLAEKIVLTIGCDTKSDDELFGNMLPEQLEDVKERLDRLHFWKIELADEVMILNKGDYIGESTSRELQHALRLGKPIKFLESVKPGSNTARILATAALAADSQKRQELNQQKGQNR